MPELVKPKKQNACSNVAVLAACQLQILIDIIENIALVRKVIRRQAKVDVC